jgi:tetratricopeptide (TPR) repeat protein
LEIYEKQKQFDKAAFIQGKIVENLQFGGNSKKNPRLLEALPKLGELHRRHGSIEQASKVYQQLLENLEDDPSSPFGRVHPYDQVRGYRAAAVFYREVGKMAEAQHLFEQALDISTRYGTREQLDLLIELAAVHIQQGQLAKAEQLYSEKIAAIERKEGPKHPATAQLRENLAVLYEAQGRKEESRVLMEEASEILKKLPSREEAFRTAILNTARLFAKHGKIEFAVALYKSIAEDSELPEDHPDRTAARQELSGLVQRR